ETAAQAGRRADDRAAADRDRREVPPGGDPALSRDAATPRLDALGHHHRVDAWRATMVSPEQLFSIANAVAAVSWLLLAVLPRRRWITGTVTGQVVPALFAVLYIGLIVS